MPGVFNPKKFLDLGRKLLMDPDYDEDSKLRTAMGRIYYAAFLVAQRRLVREGIKIQEPSKIHQEVISAYMQNGFTEIGNNLDELRDVRVDADYIMTAQLAQNQCKRYAQMSGRTIELIEQIRAFP